MITVPLHNIYSQHLININKLLEYLHIPLIKLGHLHFSQNCFVEKIGNKRKHNNKI